MFFLLKVNICHREAALRPGQGDLLRWYCGRYILYGSGAAAADDDAKVLTIEDEPSGKL